MSTDNLIFAVQAMQIPLIALTIIVLIRTEKPETLFAQGRYNNRLQILRYFERKNPFKFITVALVVNFCYILTLIGSNKNVALVHVTSEMLDRLIAGFDILITSLFAFEVVLWRFKNNRNAKYLFVAFIIILLALRLYDIVNSVHVHFNMVFRLINFVVYSLVALCVFTKIRGILKQYGTKIFFVAFSDYYVASGFFLWAILQLLPIIGVLLNLTENGIEMTGFTISAVCKMFVLVGLYDYSAKLAKLATLTHLKNSNELNQKVSVVNALQGFIRTISTATNIDQLASTIVAQMTDRKVFQYDYAVFYEIDYIKKKIYFKSCKAEDKKLDFIESWYDPNGISFNHHDVLSLVFRDQRVYKICGNKLNGTQIDVESDQSPINKRRHAGNNEYLLESHLIPILANKNSGIAGDTTFDLPDSPVGILEVGYINPWAGFTDKDIQQQGELSIYLDTCSQLLERIITDYFATQVKNCTNLCDNESKDDYIGYLSSVLTQTCKILKIDTGISIIFSANSINHHPETTAVFVGGERKLENRIQSIINKNIPDGSSKDDIIIRLKTNVEILKMLNAKSLHVKELAFPQGVYCILLFYSFETNYFSSVIIKVIDRMYASVPRLYYEKKFHHSVAELVIPNNAITDLETNLKPIIEVLQNYFQTPFVSLWLRDGFYDYILKYSSDELRNLSRRTGIEKISKDVLKFDDEYKIVKYDISDESALENNVFSRFAKDNKFNFYLRIALKTQSHVFGFLNIYFKTRIEDINYEESSFINLLSSKCVITLQIHQLVSAFKDISDTFTRNDLGETLRTIADRAMEMLHADPVVLFKSNNGVDVFFKDVTFSKVEDFRDTDTLRIINEKKDSHVELAELIIGKQSVFFNNSKEYQEYIKQNDENYDTRLIEKDFWQREELKSMAAVRLVNKIGNKGKAVGVMFINFRYEMNFSEDVKRIIETFAALAASSIANGFIFERNHRYLLQNLRMAKPILTEVIAAGTLHDAHKTYKAIYSKFYRLLKSIDDIGYGKKKMSAEDIRAELASMDEPVENLYNEFEKLATYYRPTTELHISRCNIIQIINNKIESLEPEITQKYIRIERAFAERAIIIDCDEGAIGDALFNILNNAVYALDKRGILEVRINHVNENYIKIDIIDDGKGISEEIKDFILRPYVTDKPTGSGLGLAMSELTITQHGGHLRYHSKPNRTVFTITLPRIIKSNNQA